MTNQDESDDKNDKHTVPRCEILNGAGLATAAAAANAGSLQGATGKGSETNLIRRVRG